MKPTIKVITLGVNDLERSLGFYRDGLGLPTEGIVGTEFEDGAVVFFNMNDDLILALYPRSALAKDAKVALGPSSPCELSIGHIVGSKQDVDALMQKPGKPGLISPILPVTASGEVTPDTFKTRTVTCGKSPGTLRGRPKNRRGCGRVCKAIRTYTVSGACVQSAFRMPSSDWVHTRAFPNQPHRAFEMRP
jgi:uncharacterized protein